MSCGESERSNVIRHRMICFFSLITRNSWWTTKITHAFTLIHSFSHSNFVNTQLFNQKYDVSLYQFDWVISHVFVNPTVVFVDGCHFTKRSLNRATNCYFFLCEKKTNSQLPIWLSWTEEKTVLANWTIEQP